MKFLSDILAKAGLTVDGVVTLNNTATGQTPNANDNSTKLATTAWVRTFVQPYSLPIATSSVLGGIKVGTGLSIDAGTGVLSVSGGGSASIKSTQTFTATAGQTVFTISGGYSVGLIDVFLNGVYLSPNQTTATNGTTITLGDAALAGDIIDVIIASPVYQGATTTTDQLSEGSTNLYFTNARSRSALSFVAGSGAYNSTTGVITIPTNNNQITNGSNYITLASLSAGVGISYNNTTGVITNSAPDQTVSLTAGSGISVSGTYPSFTIASTITQYTDALARAAITLTTTGVSGVATYNNTTGVFNIPNYQGLVPAGGTIGQILTKNSGTDYDSAWIENYADWTAVLKHRVKAGEAVTKGQAVYVSSADGTNMIVSKASNATEGTSSKTMGLLESTVSTNGIANVITEGLLAGLNTASANAGDPVWLGTGGNLIYGLLNKPVAPAHLVFIGVVTRSNANNGEIFVKVQNGFELDELHDLSVKNASDGDMIKYVASTGLWTKIAATTTNITEGTNLYYTQGRFDTAFTAKSTTNLSEGTNLYYTNARARAAISVTGSGSYDSATGIITVTGGVTSVNTLTGAVTLTTTNIGEGTNLYYTTARANSDFDTRLATKSTTNLAEGSNLYYTTARANSDFDTRLATKSTTNLAEGTNLYYTDTRVGTYLTGNSYATQSYVSTQINNLVSGAPGLLDTLDELAAALGDDPNFATTVSTALGDRLRIDIGTQGLTSTQQGYGRTNLGLGSLAVLSSVANAQITDVAWSKVTGTPTSISGYGITDSLVYTTSTYSNPSWITALAWSKVTGAPAFITGYTEVDTLATVTGRGASTSTAITITTALGLLVQASSEATIRLNNTGGGTEWRFNSYTNGNLYFQSGAGATNAVYFTSSGAAAFSSTVSLVDYINVNGSSNSYLNLDAANSGGNEAGIYFKIGGTAKWEQYTAANDGNLSFWNNGNGIRFLITPSGGATFTSSVTATSFVKTGGSSTQFLKADGSVDSSTYLTSYTETDTLASVTSRGASTSNPIYVDTTTGGGYVFRTSSAWGSWGRNAFSIADGSNNLLVTLGGYGNAGTSLSYAYIGLAYNNTWIQFSSSAVNSQVALQQGGNQVWHAGNFIPSNYLPLSGGTVTGKTNIGTGGSTNGGIFNVTGGTDNQMNISHNSSWGLLLGYCNESSPTGYHGPNHAAIINVQDAPLHLGSNNSSVLRIVSTGASILGNTIIHAGNYNSYALPLSGGTMSGTPVFAAAWSNAGGDYTGITNPAYKVDVASGYWRVVYKGAHSSVSGVYNFESGKNVYWGEPTDTGDYVFRGRSIKWAASNGTEYTVWNSSNLTNLNQLSNGPGYITSYTETDTLSSVVARGASSSSAITLGSLKVGPGAYPPDLSYQGLRHTSMGGSSNEYMIISANAHTYISTTTGNKVYIRPDANNSTYELVVGASASGLTFANNVVVHAGNVSSYAVTSLTDTLASVVGRGNTTGSNIITSAGMYANTFYDYYDNGYYFQGRGISRMYGIAIRGDNNSTGSDNQIFFWGEGNSTTSAIGFKANGGAFGNPTGYGDGYNTYLTMDTNGRGWVFRRGVGGSDFSSAYTAGWILNNGVAQFNSSVRSPIFYDSDNLSYYLDPNSNSRLLFAQFDNIGVGQAYNSGYRIITSGDIYLNAQGNGWAEGTWKQRRGGNTFYDVLDAGNYAGYNSYSNLYTDTLSVGSDCYAEKVFYLGYFSHGVANIVAYIDFGNIQNSGYLEVEVNSTYSNQNATGLLRKIIPFGTNVNGGQWYSGDSKVQEANGSIPDNIFIGDLEWSGSNFRLPIYHVVSSGNAFRARVKYFTQAGNAAGILNAATISTTTRTAPTNWSNNPTFNRTIHARSIKLYNGDVLGWRYSATDSGTYNAIYSSYDDTTTGITYRSGSWTSSQGITCHKFQTYSGAWQDRLVIYQDGVTHITSGAKITVQNGSSGGTDRGIWMWTAGDPNWVIYMATGGATSPAGGTTVNALDGSSSHAIRYRIYSGSGNSHIWENHGETCLMSLNGNTGNLSVKGKIVLGTFPNSTGNSGEAWIGRATDRNQGTMTVQLGGGSASSRSFEVVDYAWSVVLFSVGSNGNVTASGDITAYSDRRIKENITSIDNAINKVKALSGVYYNRTDVADKSKKIGFIAQDVQLVVPELVNYDKDKDVYSVSYANTSALLVEAIKEQQTQIESQKSEIEELKDLVKQLINR